jgi:protein-disulfide isomerase-like protein with CxxC motif
MQAPELEIQYKQVVHKETGKLFTVYNVRDKNGFPFFLIFDNNEWKYVSAKYFTPMVWRNI